VKNASPAYYKRIRKAKKMNTTLENLSVGPSTSKAFAIDMVDVKKVVINALMTGAATAVLYLSGTITSFDFGIYTPIVLPMVSAALEFAYRFLKSNVKE
jgi:hypothetical protein